MMKRTLLTLCVSVVLFAGLCAVAPAATNEWYATTGITGQDSDWYNPLNWSLGHVPTSAEPIAWRYASDTSVYNPIIIDGGTAESGTSTCGIWYAGTAGMTITNGATYDITGNLNLHNGAADLAHSPANIDFVLDGGSILNVSNETQVGRKIASANADGQVDILIDGAGTQWNQGSVMWLGWATSGENRTEAINITVSNGAEMNFNMVGGMVVNSLVTDELLIDVAGGAIYLAGDRRGQVSTMLTKEQLIAYGGSGTIDYDYDADAQHTYILSVPEPATIGLVGLGIVALIRRRQ